MSYDRATKTGSLFTEYINRGLKDKQEASGYPPHVQTEEQKEQYINEYFENEGVLLDPSK